jgi:hypothetical protein
MDNEAAASLRRRRGAELRRIAMQELGAKCVFPGCVPQYVSGFPLVEVAHIYSLNPGAPRFDSTLSIDSRKNAVILCPNHHILVDREPHKYTAEWLMNLRLQRIALTSNSTASRTASPALSSRVISTLDDLLQIWYRERSNPKEDFWHRLFVERPEALVLALEGRAYTLKSKCYVGGKGVDNTGGNIIDFIAQHRENAALVEIKTPTSKLMGARYRGNAFLASPDLLGACIQIMEYKESLAENMVDLAYRSPGLQAFNPRSVVIVGDLESEKLDAGRLRSFELFRNSFQSLRVLTYDELFEGIRQLRALGD